jgi:enediyne biosynthesis protein E3
MGVPLSQLVGALRRRILTPNASAARLDVRGFHLKNSAACELLETIGGTFLMGYRYAAEAATPAAAEEGLERIPTRFRGFAYEGAAMGFAIREGLPGGRSGKVAGFLDGRAGAHIYMVYVGVGWAMARLPRFRWSRLYAPDPLLRWLVLDGYGFHQAYFRTRRYIHEQYQERGFPWPVDGPEGYAERVIDQGIGRAAWFVGGTDARLTAQVLDAFPEQRRPDLYAGAGLAATYAGGADEAELRWFFEHAGPYRPQVAQGSAFAAGARVRAGLVVPHTEVATGVFCGTSAQEAWEITEKSLPDRTEGGPLSAFELWRQRIAQHFVSVRG